MARNRSWWAAGWVALFAGGMYLAGVATADPTPPPTTIDCTKYWCYYIKGWWQEDDGKYYGYTLSDGAKDFTPIWSGQTIQRYGGDADSAIKGPWMGGYKRVWPEGNNTCNKLVNPSGTERIQRLFQRGSGS